MRILTCLSLMLPLCAVLGGCTTWAPGDGRLLAGFVTPDPSLEAAKAHFRSGDYGLAETAFRRAVESRPADGEAWLGLAAAQDQLGRFDLADKSYIQAERLVGTTATFYNNRGYSYLLRGDARRARQDLGKALRMDPGNAAIKANLSLTQARP